MKSLCAPSSDLPIPLSCNAQALQSSLLSSLLLFLKNLGFNKEETNAHQLYVHEAIELNESTTILLVLPPADHVCTAPGSSDHFANLADFVALPINTFEISELVGVIMHCMLALSLVAYVDMLLLMLRMCGHAASNVAYVDMLLLMLRMCGHAASVS